MQRGAWLALDSDTLHVCALSDISETGARLDVDKPDAVPDRFVLLLSDSGSVRRRCRVVWRKAQQIGVTFEGRLAPSDSARRARFIAPVEPT